MKPAVTSSATGISAKSSRLRALIWRSAVPGPTALAGGLLLLLLGTLARLGLASLSLLVLALCPARRRGRGSRRPLSLLDVVDDVRGVVLGAQLVLGHDLLALGRERGGLHPDRALLRVEVDPERQVVGQAAVERDPAVLVGAEEVDLAGEEEARREHRDDRGDRGGDLEPAAAGGAAAASGPGRGGGRPRAASARRSGRPARRSARSAWRPRRAPRPPRRAGRRRR